LITEQEKIIKDLAICDITIDDAWRKFYIVTNLPNNDIWQNIVSTLKLTDKADTVAYISANQLSFEVKLCTEKCLAPVATLFVTNMGRGQASNSTEERRKGDSHVQKC